MARPATSPESPSIRSTFFVDTGTSAAGSSTWLTWLGGLLLRQCLIDLALELRDLRFIVAPLIDQIAEVVAALVEAVRRTGLRSARQAW